MEPERSVEVAINNRLAVGFTRAIIWMGVPIIVGLMGWFGGRFVTTLDDIGKQLVVQSANISLLQQAMSLRASQRDSQMKELAERVGDHEIRIRLQEQRVVR